MAPSLSVQFIVRFLFIIVEKYVHCAPLRTGPWASVMAFQRPSLRALRWLATVFVANMAAVNSVSGE